MSVRHAMLALRSEGPKYGMQLRDEFEARTGEVWTLNVGQVYTTLQRLERDGLIAAAPGGRPAVGQEGHLDQGRPDREHRGKRPGWDHGQRRTSGHAGGAGPGRGIGGACRAAVRGGMAPGARQLAPRRWESVFRPHGAERYASQAQLTLEARLLARAQAPGAARLDPETAAQMLGADRDRRCRPPARPDPRPPAPAWGHDALPDITPASHNAARLPPAASTRPGLPHGGGRRTGPGTAPRVMPV